MGDSGVYSPIEELRTEIVGIVESNHRSDIADKLLLMFAVRLASVEAERDAWVKTVCESTDRIDNLVYQRDTEKAAGNYWEERALKAEAGIGRVREFIAYEREKGFKWWVAESLAQAIETVIADPYVSPRPPLKDRVPDDMLERRVVAERKQAATQARAQTLHDVKRIITESDILRNKFEIVEWLGHQEKGATL